MDVDADAAHTAQLQQVVSLLGAQTVGSVLCIQLINLAFFVAQLKLLHNTDGYVEWPSSAVDTDDCNAVTTRTLAFPLAFPPPLD